MAKSKKRFKIIDKGNHVIKKDLMTSTVYSYPKNEYKIYPRSKVEKLVADFIEEHKIYAEYGVDDDSVFEVRFIVEEDECDD